MKKKLISALLTLCMVLSLLPVSALADEPPTIKVTPGNMVDHSESGNPTTPLCTAGSYKAPESDPGADGKIPVTVEAKQIVKHTNGQGTQGYWIGATFTPEGSGYVILYTIDGGTTWFVDTDSCTDGSIVSLYIDAFKDGNLNTKGGDITVGVFTESAVTSKDTTTGAVTIDGTGEPLRKQTYTVMASEGCTKEGDVESVTIDAIDVKAGEALPTEIAVTSSEPENSVTTPAEISWAEKGVSGGDAPETATAGKTYTATITVTPETDYTLTDKTVYTIGSGAVEKGDVTVDDSGTATLTKEFAVPSAEFTVTFNAGTGATVSPTTDTTTNGKLASLPTPTKSGYTFGGWFENEACTGTAVTVNTTYTENTTLYAKWTENVTPTPTKYTVSFNAGDGTGTMAAAEVNKAATGDTTYTLPECTFTAPTGKTFAGWKVGDADGVQPAGAVVTLTADTTMTATWATEVKADDAPVEVTNNTATATVTAPATVNSGEVVTIDASKDSQSKEIPSDGITASEGVTAAEVTLPKAAVDTLKNASSVEVTTPIGSITLPQTALTTINASVTASTPATLTIAPTDKASEVTSTDTTTEVSATFEVKVTTGTGTNEKEIDLSATALGNQFIKLALNIGKGLNNPKICYLSDDGKTLGDALAVSVPYDTTTGTVTVLAPHLTNFAILTDKATTSDLKLTSVSNHGNFVVKCKLENAKSGTTYLIQVSKNKVPVYFTATAENGEVIFFAEKNSTVQAWEDGDFNSIGVPSGNGIHMAETTVTAAE